VCLWLCGSVTTITRNCVHRSYQTGSVGEGSDHLQLITFWQSYAPGKGSATGRKFLAQSYYSQHAVFASLCALFHFLLFPYESLLWLGVDIMLSDWVN